MSNTTSSTLPANSIVGVGMDNNLYLRTTLNSDWTLIPSSDSVTGVAVTRTGRIFGIGMDRLLYKRDTMSPPWTKLPGGGEFLAISAMGDGLLGVGMDNFLYTIDTAGKFNKVPNSGSVTGAVARSSQVFGIGMNRQLYKRETLSSPWTALPGGGEFLAITTMGDILLGVGMDNFLYTVNTAGNFSKVPNSGSVTAVACHP